MLVPHPEVVVLPLLLALSLPRPADAFCGFYVSGADANLYANATLVVLMREGKRTVLSMQNNYQGPPQDFAMVVPVPTVLQKENVRTLPREVFQHVDQLSAPRLVEYWEEDPCAPRYRYKTMKSLGYVMEGAVPAADDGAYGVKIEAQFSVAEYDIVILSATDSTGLDKWLKANAYNIPAGAEPVLRPYVESGTKFFVAKVDIERVTFVDGQAVLSPLRVHYDSDRFDLPVRLGLLNSDGTQDLLVHILARNQRYEVANYENATIPTNIRVMDGVRDDFGSFYNALFDKAVEGHPKTVVTEYAWVAGSCDPCPSPVLDEGEILTLGGDVTGNGSPWDYVLTRMHYRYTRDALGEDLVFQAAPPIVGGRGVPNPQGELGERTAEPAGFNNFQGRYVILHPWDGPVACETPERGIWGGPPGGGEPTAKAAASRLSGGAAPGKVALASMVAEDVPSIGLKAAASPKVSPARPVDVDDPAPPDGPSVEEGDPICAAAPAAGLFGMLVGLGVALTRRR